ncbi:hypothetical protein HY492_03820 [Candidatus Woesearchaeota archaeon]|nr:hypothetical protein [Candidatus Woesearchaeota archaeon]
MDSILSEENVQTSTYQLRKLGDEYVITTQCERGTFDIQDTIKARSDLMAMRKFLRWAEQQRVEEYYAGRDG